MLARAEEILSGTLRLRKKIADGGMGSVYVAEHLVLGTDVAVKLMAKPWASVPSARARFLREARMTANIESPHVVRVLDCRHDASDEPYIVLELLHGETLEQRVRKTGVLSLFEVEEVVRQTCEALACVHAARIVHRDVKPENVFLMAGGAPFVKLLDFGVAKPMAESECVEVDHLPAGTPQYMSPEHMFEPQATDARSDLFSLGAVAYFALTHRSPFDADSLEGLYLAIENDQWTRPSALRPELPAAVDRWFEKALAKNPDDRFQNARAMAKALSDAIREGSAVAAAPAANDNEEDVGPAEIDLRLPVVRPRARTAIGMALAVAASIGFIFFQRGLDVPTANASPPAQEVAIQDASPPPDDAHRLAVEVPTPVKAPVAPPAKKVVAHVVAQAKAVVAEEAAPLALDQTATDQAAALDAPARLDILENVPNPNVTP